jgi:Fe-S oxidoreductase
MNNSTIKTMAEYQAEGKMPDVLFWVGCAGSYDARAIRISRAFTVLLERAGVSYAILGDEENCCGDPARRAGNEFVFQMLALQNIELLNAYGVRKIVTTCPHGYNTLKNEYPKLGGQFTVMHHTQFLWELIESGKLSIKDAKINEWISYHDSCYLGRVNDEYDAPRKLIKTLSSQFREVRRSREKGFCCGAGGAQMFKEEEKGHDRVNNERAKEFIGTGCRIIAANCPFCVTMLEDGLKDQNKEEEIRVMDLAEILSSQLTD